MLALACVLAGGAAAQSSAKTAAPSSSDKITPQTRIQVIRSLHSERVFARVTFPQGEKGLKIKNGVVTPSEQAIAQAVAESGPAAKPGDRCVITNIEIKDKEIVVEINGGPKKKGKWYQHIQVSGGGGATGLPGTSPQSLDAHGSVVTLEFEKYVPELSGDQVRAMLDPVFDFKALTASEAYQKTLPPKLKEAIRDHKILVGMDKEMVLYSKGRPQQRIRDKDDKGEDYEEWIYGKPPEEVNFVRFQGNEVARLEIMNIDGSKVVRTEREVDLPNKEAELAADQKPAQKPQQAAPTLRRPGEEPEFPTTTSTHRTPRPEDSRAPQDGQPYPDPTGTAPPGGPPIDPPHLRPAS
jgi:hypothetical protein